VNEDMVSVLDKCIEEMEHGASLEACVAQYPALAAQLEPLLRLVLDIQSLGQEPAPPPLNLQAGRRRVLREAARLRVEQREQEHSKQSPWWLNLPALLRRSAAAAALASVLLVTILGAGTVAISANSLPGDALYPVKRIGEEVQLFLTLDEQRKAQLVDALDARRRQEALAVSSSQRVAELSFRGAVDSIEDGRWTIGGVPVRLSDETSVGDGVTVGSFVRVEVRSLSDGTLLALRIAVEPAAKPPRLTASPTPAAGEATPTELTVPSPTPTTTPTTRVVVQPASSTSTPSPTPTATESSTPSPTPTATDTPLPPRQVKIRFAGPIDEIGADTWTIDGRVVRVDANTSIDQSQAQAAVGATASVVAVRDDDGGLVAVSIIIEPPPQAPPEPFEFRGLIENYGADSWTVGGYSLAITPDTAVEGSPKQGLLAQVKAVRLGDGSLVAVQIVVQPPTEEVQFEGLIQSLAAGEWIVEGVIVRLDEETVVEGKPALGAMAEVQGLLLADGAVLALRIVIQPPVAATVTPSQAPATETPATLLRATEIPTLTETALSSIQR